MIYFTSDLHLGHSNVLKLCNRPFETIEEMDEKIIENWNKKVTNADTVYILGDVMFRNKKAPEEYLSRLKGKKHLIRGNHDRTWMKKVDIDKYFLSNENLAFMSDGKHRITMCHYPMMSWPHMSTDGYMIHGHIHANTNADYWPLIEKTKYMLNAGMDINGFVPVTFDEMLQNNEEHKAGAAAHRIIEENRGLFEDIAKLQQKAEEIGLILDDDYDFEGDELK